MELPGAEGVGIVLVTEPLCAIWGGANSGFHFMAFRIWQVVDGDFGCEG